MITAAYWIALFSLEVVEEYTPWDYHDQITPMTKAFFTILGAIFTPPMLCLDLILSPLELILWLLTKHYKKEIK